LRRPRPLQLLGLGLALAVTAALAAQVARDWSTLTHGGLAVLRPDARFLLVAWGVQSAGWLLVVATWASILGRLGGAGIAFRRHLWAHTWSGLTNVLPGSIWLPVSRVAAYRAAGLHPVVVGAAMAIEWLLLGIAGLALYALAAPWSQMPRAVSLIALVAAAALAAVALHPRVFGQVLGRMAGRFGLAAAPPQARPADLMRWCAAEWVVLALAGLGLYLVMRAAGPVASLPDALAATGLTLALANLLAWLPASAVLKDASMVVLLTPLYGAVGPALVVVVVWRLWVAGVQLSWAGLALVALRRAGAPLTGAEEEPWTITPGA
jgi:hypothetical protein